MNNDNNEFVLQVSKMYWNPKLNWGGTETVKEERCTKFEAVPSYNYDFTCCAFEFNGGDLKS